MMLFAIGKSSTRPHGSWKVPKNKQPISLKTISFGSNASERESCVDGVLAYQDVPPDFVQDESQTTVTVYMGFVSFMILIWEHMITFDDEVNYVWFGTKGPLVWLFFLISDAVWFYNQFVRCGHFVRYEGSMTVTGLNTTALMMFLRVYAMYPRRWAILAFVFIIFLVELSVNAWLLTHGVAVVHNRAIHACTMIFDQNVPGHIASASAWLPLLYDTVILILTLNRTLQPVRHQAAGKIMRVLLRDGILYYSVIFSINLVLTLMIASAPPGIQNITAQLEYLLTVAMMSRITIHLKKQAKKSSSMDQSETVSVPLRPVLRSSRMRFAHELPITITVEELVTRDEDSRTTTEDEETKRRDISQQTITAAWRRDSPRRPNIDSRPSKSSKVQFYSIT
ncbi:hypothetical protein C8Q75DRAFT_809308 [Abortiporus biennis]|nr:hypothetical protein C8Q75DRAFT_809308 [Abortiporus biennis]